VDRAQRFEPGAPAVIVNTSENRASTSDLDAVREQIAFFMGRTFEVSFGYFGVMAGLAVAAKLSIVNGIADAIRISAPVVIASAIGLFNALYLAIAFGMLGAVLKRGAFLVKHNDGVWERYVHTPPAHEEEALASKVESLRNKVRSRLSASWHRHAWQLDNYYMVPLFAAIVLSTGGALAFGFLNYVDCEWIVMGAVALFDLVVVGASLLAVVSLNHQLERQFALAAQRATTASGPMGLGAGAASD